MTSCRWPNSSCRSRSASSASMRSARVSPMPIRMPEVNGTAAAPAARMVVEADRGNLVGAVVMRAALLAEPLRRRLQHDALRHRHRPQRGDLGSGHDAGIDVRQQTRLGEHQPGHRGEVGDRRVVTQARQLLARGHPAQLRLVAQREQGLAAAGLGACARDRQHLVGRQVAALAAPRRLDERAVVALVAAQSRQRNEHLARVGDQVAMAGIADDGRCRHHRLRGRRSRRASAPPRRTAGCRPGRARARWRSRSCDRPIAWRHCADAVNDRSRR